jgi:hypothetical protein
MANNKTIRDGNGTPFITKTTETAGVNTPHVNIDNLQTNYALEAGGNLENINNTLANNTQNTVSFYTALQDDVLENQYYKNDVISRTDFYKQYGSDYLNTRWDNITQGSTDLNTPDLANLLLQGIEKDTPFEISGLGPGSTSAPIDVSNISSVSFASTGQQIKVIGSVDGSSYDSVTIFNLTTQRYIGDSQIGSIDVSSFKTIKFINFDPVASTTINGFLSMLPVTPNGDVALQQETNGLLNNINSNTVNVPNVIAQEGGPQPTRGVVVMGHTGAGIVKHILVDSTGKQIVNVNNSALPTGAATAANQTNGTQKTKITDGTLDASLLQGGAGYVGLLTSVGPALFLSSTANSSTAQLTAGATFTGTIETVFSQPAIQINMVSDQPIIITINQYIDAAGLKRSGAYAYSIPAGAGFDMCLPVAGNYFNVTAQNIGAATTTTFTLDVTYGTMQAVDTYGAQTVSMTQLAYGTANAVYVGGTSQIQVTPTLTSASAYATGNVVGGLLTFPNIVNSTVRSGVLESITIAVKSLQTTSFKLYIFSGIPTTTFTNKTAPAIVTADANKLLDVYSFTTPDNGLGNNVTLYYSDAINRSLVLDGSSMYGVLVCLGTPTFTTTTDVVVTASILRD